MSRLRKILILGIIIVASAGVYTWLYLFNEGGVILSSSGITGYKVQGSDFNYYCQEDPCTFRLKQGFYNLTFEKEGYFPIETSIEVNRAQETELQVEFNKIPTLTISPIVPVDEAAEVNSITPPALSDRLIYSPTWNREATRLAFIDSLDNRLKIWSSNSLKSVTPLSATALSFYWSPDENFLLGYDNEALYLIDLETARRKKIPIDFAPIKILWSPDESHALLNGSDETLYRFSVEDQSIELLSTYINLEHARFLDSESLIFYENDIDAGVVYIQQFNPQSQLVQQVIDQNEFQVDDIRSTDEKIYFRNIETKTWYLLENN